MCGIAGIIDLEGRPVEREMVERMCGVLRHRGPDGEGYWLNSHAALGQRRLSIIDFAGGQQPMSNEDGTVWLTFNGEIYNFQELRVELESLGHRFATDSDTEVIVHAYEQFGCDCVQKLRGMFAFAIWDQREETLFLARDRVGKKPLFYTESEGQFIFASELQSLREHPAVDRTIRPSAIDDFLTFGYIPAPQTIYEHVYKLPPASHLTLKLRETHRREEAYSIERYWTLPYSPKLQLTEAEAVAGLRQVLTEAVRLRMISDAPLGALLSGGVDSSIVVALMSQLSEQPVKTFSVGFEDQAFNELPYARMVADRYNTDHHELVVKADALAVLPTLIRHYGEPFADSSAVPSYYVSQLTREHVTVALNGDGGDESFAGYDRYLGALLADRYRRIPRLLRAGVIEPLLSLVPTSLSRRNRLRQAKRFSQVAGMSPATCYLRWISYFTPDQKQALYTEEFQSQLQGYEAGRWFLNLYAQSAKTHEPIDAFLATDVQSYLPYDLLVKMDIASMANSLEARSPFLDHEVMEFCARLPSHFKQRRGTLKYLLKKLGEELLPTEVMHRRKMGFGVPMARWMRGELRTHLEDALTADGARIHTYVQVAEVRRLLDTHCRGGDDHSAQLWALYWLELWLRQEETEYTPICHGEAVTSSDVEN